MTKERVVIAMSGGVDSSLAAALLVEQGYDVVGIMLRLWSAGDNGTRPTNRCCALDAQYDAERVAELLGIPFYVINVADEFKRHVVDYFSAAYTAGRTPNPCVECNRHIRFDLLLRRALALGADYLATGHYVRVLSQEDHFLLLRGVDRHKDQSYVLHVLGQRELARARFPLGMYTKEEVRAMAEERSLPVAQRRDSQDLCFIADRDYHTFFSKHAATALRPGPIIDTKGRVIGEHSGLACYTIGQRKGIGVSAPERLYVLELDPEHNTLIVGTADELGRDACLARCLNWVAGAPPAASFRALAKIRYKARDAAVTVQVTGGESANVQFEHPQRDITPGQAIVLYRDEIVLGGGTILWPKGSR
jgi:tRNA-specific 2-thiouridylase